MKRVLVVGGSGGIGSVLAESLAEENQVIVLGRNKTKLDDLVKKVGGKKNLDVVVSDVTNCRQIEKLFGCLNELDVLINCVARLRPVGLFLDNDLGEWKKTIGVNLLGTVNCCYYALPLLLKSRRGKIINFGGGGAAYGRLGHSAYASSKTAVVRFTETLAMEYPDVDINVIAPGAYKTNMWKDEKMDKEPKKWGDMEKLKRFIGFLVSDKSDGITGKFLHYKDNWENMDPKKLEDFMFTLRRIDDFKFIDKK